MSIEGPSGSGKTTLLEIIAGLIEPISGSVNYEKTDAKVAYIFQNHELIPFLTISENIRLAVELNSDSRDPKQCANNALESTGIAHLSNELPESVSGGELQRAAIAQALAVRPEIIIADEPTGELDAASSLKIANLLRELAHSENTLVIVATHDYEVAKVCDRRLGLKNLKLSEFSNTRL